MMRTVVETAEMIVRFLETSTVEAGRREEQEWFTVERGVAQGSPLSPTLYSIFMDTFGEALDAVPRSISKDPCKLFADDVKLSAAYAKGLETILEVSLKWDLENCMKWNTKKCRYMDERHMHA